LQDLLDQKFFETYGSLLNLGSVFVNFRQNHHVDDKGVQVTSGDLVTSFTSKIENDKHLNSLCYATFDRGLAQAEKVGVRGVGSIKFIRVPGEHSAFIKKNKRNKKNDSKQNEIEDKKRKWKLKLKVH
jgi:hypothetical protein